MSVMTSAPSPTSADALPTLLAWQAAQRGSDVAVRYKAHGLCQTSTWRSLERAFDDARVSPAGEQPSTHALGLAWLVRSLAKVVAEPEVSASARQLQTSWTAHDVLWLDPQLDLAGALRSWLQSGAVLAVGEAIDTVEVDRRALAPTVLLAEARWYDQLTADVRARAARARGARALLLRWALGPALDAAQTSPSPRWLARRLVLRPVLDQLGLTCTRLALSLGQPGEHAQALFAALQVPLCLHGHNAAARTDCAQRALPNDETPRFVAESGEAHG